MKDRLFRLFRGYLLVRLSGYSPERFLNLCMANQIRIWDLRYREKGYVFFITVPDFYRVKALVKKAQVHLRIEGRYGLPFFLHRNRRRKLYGAGLLAFFLILACMSQFIWKISIEGNRRFTDDSLLHYLDTLDIRYGRSKHGIDCDLLEESIRSQYPQIIWVSARISGTKLLIRIKENETAASVKRLSEEPQHLTAEKAGRITSILVRSGKAQVNPGDDVQKGQLLVSGLVPIYNDAGEVDRYLRVRADADIRARTAAVFSTRLPLFTAGRSYTGRIRQGCRLRVLNLDFLWLLPADPSETWEISGEYRQLVLFEDFYLPVWFQPLTAKEYTVYERGWTRTELESLKNQINNDKIEGFLQKGVQIIENNVKILDRETYLELREEFVLEESIGVGSPIESIEEQTEQEAQTTEE